MKAHTPSETFAKRLAIARRARNWSQARLAKILDELGHPMHPTALSRIEKETRQVTIDDAVAIAAALDVALVHMIFPIHPEGKVALTPKLEVDVAKATRWARGRQPLDPANVRMYSYQHLGDVNVINPEASPEQKAAAQAEFEEGLRAMGVSVAREERGEES
jgi:transcriptional regulator with XRE-family HTH domain